MAPLITRSSPVTARICASTAWRRASRLSSQEVAIRAISTTPRNAATGVPRRFIPWAIVNDISESGWNLAGRAGVDRVAVVESRMQAGSQTHVPTSRNLMGFLDPFKAVGAGPVRRGRKRVPIFRSSLSKTARPRPSPPARCWPH